MLKNTINHLKERKTQNSKAIKKKITQQLETFLELVTFTYHIITND